MEQKMATYSKQVMEKNTKDVISKMSATLQTRAQKFNGEFQRVFIEFSVILASNFH
jgi:predicted nucleic acid-binding Zn ribbon protein